MQKKWKLSAILMIAAVGTLFGACKHPHCGFYGPEERITHLIDKIGKELSLDAAQKEELEQIVRDVKEKFSDMAQERQTQHQELIALVRKDTVTQKDLNDMMAVHREKMKALTDFAGQQFIRFHAQLTPSQREELAGLIEAHVEKHHHFH